MSIATTETTIDSPPPYQETVLRVGQIADEEGECCQLSTQIQYDPTKPTAAVPVPTSKTTGPPKQPTEEDPSAEQEPSKCRKRDRLISGLKKCGKKCAKPFVWFGQTQVGRPFAITAIVVGRAVKYLAAGVLHAVSLICLVTFLLLAEGLLCLTSCLYPEGLEPGQPLRRLKDWLE